MSSPGSPIPGSGSPTGDAPSPTDETDFVCGINAYIFVSVEEEARNTIAAVQPCTAEGGRTLSQRATLSSGRQSPGG